MGDRKRGETRRRITYLLLLTPNFSSSIQNLKSKIKISSFLGGLASRKRRL